MKKLPVALAAALATAMFVAAALTRRDLSRPNLWVFPQMADGPSYRSHTPNPVLPGGVTLQPPVAGTIPRGFVPFAFANTPDDRKRAGLELANPVPRTLKDLTRGQVVFENYCLHCHGARGEGDGGVARRVPAFSMAVSGPATAAIPDGELFHIITYGRNNMPGHGAQLAQADRWRLVHYLRDLQGAEYGRRDLLDLARTEDPRPETLVSVEYGAEIYGENCEPCHGRAGENPKRGVPTLNNPRVLAVAADDYYLDIITHGRKGTQMPAWAQTLTPGQIQSVVRFIRSWRGADKESSSMAARLGTHSAGEALFRGNCAPCHGRRGEGGIGISLAAPSFLSMASESFLSETIARGRAHTAMPSGHAFASRDISDILAYLGGWSRPRSTFEAVREALPAASSEVGRKLFRGRCESCHGQGGAGGIGPRLDGDEWLALATDEFLYRSIVEGRPGTAMPSWRFLESDDVADLIAFLRSRQKSPARNLSSARHPGRAEFGEFLFAQACRACHGKEGEGGLGNQIANPVFLDSVSDEFLWQTIAYGKRGTAMRGFLEAATGGALMPMTPGDVDHVIAFLRRQAASARSRPLERPIVSARLDLGREVYEGKGACAKCHGASGEGASGPSLGNPDFLAAASDGYLIGTILLGREGTEMRAFDRSGNVQLSPQEVESVAFYLRSLGSTETRARREVPRTPAVVEEGAALYAANCASCHGSAGQGPAKDQAIAGYAPSLNNQDFLRAADDGFLLATIALGRPGTPMRPFGKGAGGISDLEADEIRKIVAFIRTWEKKNGEKP